MLWWCKLPGHQQPWYWLCKIKCWVGLPWGMMPAMYLNEPCFSGISVISNFHKSFQNSVLVANNITYWPSSPSPPVYIHRADSRFAPSQWEMALLCNDVSHWLGADLESAMYTELNFSLHLIPERSITRWSTLGGAIFYIDQIFPHVVRRMNRTKYYLGCGYFVWIFPILGQ